MIRGLKSPDYFLYQLTYNRWAAFRPRGNIVYWDEKQKKAVILKAQEVFSLSVLAELTYSIWKNGSDSTFKPAVAVNCPTSMRIEEIANTLGAQVFRAEVGEANVVNLAREKRAF